MRVFLFAFVMLLSATLALAETPTQWTDWVDGTVTPSKVNGLLNGQAVTFTGTGPILSAQNGGVGQVNFWATSPSTYTGGAVINAPATADIVRILGPGTYTVTFAQPVTNPVMAILSLGGLATATFNFGTQPVTLLKTGPGHFGNVVPLTVTGSIVSARESNGLVQFPGTMTTLTFTMPVGENWVGITVGLPPVATPPPPPPAFQTFNLEWFYLPHDPIASPDVTRIYRGLNTLCDAPAPLTALIADVTYPTLTYRDAEVLAVPGKVCYEASAMNVAGESIHSSRVTVPTGVAIPGAPTNLRVQ